MILAMVDGHMQIQRTGYGLLPLSPLNVLSTCLITHFSYLVGRNHMDGSWMVNPFRFPSTSKVQLLACHMIYHSIIPQVGIQTPNSNLQPHILPQPQTPPCNLTLPSILHKSALAPKIRYLTQLCTKASPLFNLLYLIHIHKWDTILNCSPILPHPTLNYQVTITRVPQVAWGSSSLMCNPTCLHLCNLFHSSMECHQNQKATRLLLLVISPTTVVVVIMEANID